MERLIAAVSDWPALAQAIVGSALFWLIVQTGERLAAHVSKRVSLITTQMKETSLRTELIRLRAVKAENDEEGSVYASILLFRMFRPLIKGLMWLTLGLLFSRFISVLGEIGYLWCLYYLFGAHVVVRQFGRRFTAEEIEARIKEVDEQIDALSRESKKAA